MASGFGQALLEAARAAFWRRESGAVVLLAGGAAALAALVSHSGSDPAPFLTAGRTGPTGNWLGPVGAFASSVLFRSLGAAAFAVPFVMFHAGSERLRPPKPDRDPGAARALILTSLVVSTCGLLALAQQAVGPGASSPGLAGFAWGGYFGSVLVAGLSTVLGSLGAGLVLIAAAAIGGFALRPWGSAASGGKPGDSAAPGRIARIWVALRDRWRARERDQERKATRRQFVARIERRRRTAAAPAPAARPVPRTAQGGDLFASSASARSRPRRASRPRARPDSGSGDWKLPSVQLLTARANQPGPPRRVLEERRRALEAACEEHGIRGQVERIQPGPVVTTFEFRLGEGETVNKLRNRHEELSMALRARAIRVERVPGKGVVGVEVPNPSPSVVGLRELLEADEFTQNTGALPVAVGRLVDGRPLVRNLAEMPHLLIAGATGAGKSVQINTLLASLLFRQTPDDLRLILIDPKRVELRPYRNLPHLLTPLILEPDQAKTVLQRACLELERRTRILEEHGVRNIEGYNRQIDRLEAARTARRKRRSASAEGETAIPARMARLVIVVDELADLFIQARSEVTPAIQRLLSLGRAEGIHLVLATQRPSTDIISGTLKANLPTRIAFRVASYVDSRTILDRVGAENLLGKGDMLVMQAGAVMPRAQGAFVDEREVGRLAKYWQKAGEPIFDAEMLREEAPAQGTAAARRTRARSNGAVRDEMLAAAREVVVRERKASTSMLQTELGLGYQRARRIVAELERQGVVGPARGANPREVLVQA